MSIAENLKYLRKRSGFTQEQFAQELGIKRSLVGAYEEGRAEPRLQNLVKISEVLNVSVDGLIGEDMTIQNPRKFQRERIKILPITLDRDDNENIELINQKASAGYLNGFSDPEYISELPKFQLPILAKNATYRAFELVGDSMLPLSTGSIVIGKYIDSVQDIKNGKTYVLITHTEGIVYKRLFNYIEERGKLYLVSDNQAYSAYEIDPEEVEEAWEARAFISIDFPDPAASKEISIDKLTDIVLDIQKNVKNIKDNFDLNN
ncbi:MAG: helix-turn-helix domain-containing protein [Flammeovirgaceae bacterium]|jgi:transcriptional regulator with XRE-family HTH domain|nr:helix-turn-helix domain-containing protein [Flammeovirgaceae bacterium]|tara:strand:+ start:18345 stop:19130 length:786 start_codon:yes stop_codon:yes gene_type:complete